MGKINGTWRLVKGSVSKGGFLHINKLFPEGKEYCLSDDEFIKMDMALSDTELHDRIISMNLHDLKTIHPLKDIYRPHGRPQDPFAPERPNIRGFDERFLYDIGYDEGQAQTLQRMHNAIINHE